MYRHIVFDLDGTTLDTDYSWLTAMQQLVKAEFGKDMEISELTRYRGMAYNNIYEQFGAKTDEEQMRYAKMHVERMLRLRDHDRVFDGIVELLDALKARGLQVGVVTSRIASEMNDALWHTVSDRFGVVVHGSMVTRLKPDPEPMELYRRLAGAKKEEILFLGDSPFDALCAKNSGVDFALVLWGAHDKTIEAQYKPEHPLDILDIVDAAKCRPQKVRELICR